MRRGPWLRGGVTAAVTIAALASPLGAQAQWWLDDRHFDQEITRPTYAPDAIPPHQYGAVDQAMPLSESNRPPDYYLAIYSGSTTGVYFFVASAICRTMQARFSEHRIHCVALRSSGVGDNIELMRAGRAQFVIVQSDTNYDANAGTTPLPGARSIMSLHNESGVLVVRRNSRIQGVEDLRGRRVNLGPEGSGNRALWDELLAYYDMDTDDFDRVFEIDQAHNVQGLCDGHIDAFGIWIGHPASVVQDAVDSCDARIVSMGAVADQVGPEDASAAIERLLRDREFYSPATIPAGTYTNQLEDVHSYGFKASLVGFEEASDHVTYWLTRTLAEEVETLRRAHPALANVDPYAMFSEGNFLPFHDAAARYWHERGWYEGDLPEIQLPEGLGLPETLPMPDVQAPQIMGHPGTLPVPDEIDPDAAWSVPVGPDTQPPTVQE